MAFGQVLGTIGSMIPETEAIFESEHLAKQHPDLILEQAREVLMLRSLHALREINTLRSGADAASAQSLELEEETRRDSLTGVYNRAYLEQFLAREFDNSTRHKWPLSVAFVDLDNFKQLNENFGHQAGDRVLQATARILRGNTRETDMIARHGGEEFVVVLPATDADTAHNICERIVMAFRNTGHVVGSHHAKVTVSIGCATHGAQIQFANSCRLRQGGRSSALHGEAARPQSLGAIRSAIDRARQERLVRRRSPLAYTKLSCSARVLCRNRFEPRHRFATRGILECRNLGTFTQRRNHDKNIDKALGNFFGEALTNGER